MAEVVLDRARIEPGKETRVREWFDELRERESEVLETLRHEGVFTETAFIHSTNDSTYLYMYMEADDFQKAREAGDKEKFEIDEEHHRVLQETCAEWERLETLSHFTNPSLR